MYKQLGAIFYYWCKFSIILIQLKVSSYTDNIYHYMTILYMPLGSVCLQPEDDWSYGVEGVPDAL